METSTGNVIYDFGMNTGENLPYYLKKSQLVVAIDANAALCKRAEERFATEIAAGRLQIVNAILSDKDEGDADFFICRESLVSSQFPEPARGELHRFDRVTVRQRQASSIVRQFGTPHYIKLDVEHYDQEVLRDLFSAGIFPDNISAESHSIEIFALLVANGYTAFTLVDGWGLPYDYHDAAIATVNGPERYSFGLHSAGPFGEDLITPWYGRDAFFNVLASAGLGWRDIHASRTMAPQIVASPRLQMRLRDHLSDLLPAWRRKRLHRRKVRFIEPMYRLED